MVSVGELGLWAAMPLLAVAALASIAGSITRRRSLAAFGGRLSLASALLILAGVAALGYALVTVQLRYSFVAANSGFQTAPRWRLAALWLAPGGGAMVLVLLVSGAGALSALVGQGREAAARTGSLAAMAFVGLVMVVSRAQPFAQPDVPATVGLGMPLAAQNAGLQIEVWAVYLAAACAAFAFAGIIGAQIAEVPGKHRQERFAASLAAAFLTIAVFAAAWRAYGDSGVLLSAEGAARTSTHAAAWLLAIAYLHAPAGAAAPLWAYRWRRILGVALFPAALGAAGAMLAARGSLPPPPSVWAGGLAVGVIAGAMAGMSRGASGVPGLEKVPGYGGFALAGGLVGLGLAGAAAVSSLLEAANWGGSVWLAFGLILVLLNGWLIARPVRGRRLGSGQLLGIGALAALVAAAAFFAAGGVSFVFPLLAGLGAGVTVGSLFELLRLRSVLGSDAAGVRPADVWRGRTLRRTASVLTHLGITAVIVSLSAGLVARSSTRLMSPGDRFALGGNGSVSITYLGLSRFQVGGLDKTVASFMLDRGGGVSKLIMAESTYDFVARTQTRRPAMERGFFRDVSAGIAGRGEGEDILVRLAQRPLVGLLWVGGGLLWIGFLLSGVSGLAPAAWGPSEEDRRGAAVLGAEAVRRWSSVAGELLEASSSGAEEVRDS